MQGLYTEDYHYWEKLKKIKITKSYILFKDEKLDIITMSISPQMVYRINTISIKIPAGFFGGSWQI